MLPVSPVTLPSPSLYLTSPVCTRVPVTSRPHIPCSVTVSWSPSPYLNPVMLPRCPRSTLPVPHIPLMLPVSPVTLPAPPYPLYCLPPGVPGHPPSHLIFPCNVTRCPCRPRSPSPYLIPLYFTGVPGPLPPTLISPVNVTGVPGRTSPVPHIPCNVTGSPASPPRTSYPPVMLPLSPRSPSPYLNPLYVTVVSRSPPPYLISRNVPVSPVPPPVPHIPCNVPRWLPCNPPRTSYSPVRLPVSPVTPPYSYPLCPPAPLHRIYSHCGKLPVCPPVTSPPYPHPVMLPGCPQFPPPYLIIPLCPRSPPCRTSYLPLMLPVSPVTLPVTYPLCPRHPPVPHIPCNVTCLPCHPPRTPHPL
ncbi:hypothetical protein GDO86_018847 [Hymenochirus boettgeri]|uniref:Uncharacterized protein n=1 Tax=Hymenochirus boettgeri TaxID=247094 RepID=A0A8T2IGM0_9PIPI|nr:hypothetical protein GDO86_018847 [Hymenochirus boettgeri]